MKLHKIIVTLLVVNFVNTECRLRSLAKLSLRPTSNESSKSEPLHQIEKGTNYRLPSSVKPKNYKIVLTPYFDHELEKNFTFDGLVEITIEIEKEIPEIILHSRYLDFNHEQVFLRRQDNDQSIDTVIEDNLEKHFKYIKPKMVASLTSGTYILSIAYKGFLNTEVEGFYRTSYKNEKGETIWLATTQFEPIGARQAFPCFDEPELKATFDLTIRHPFNYSAISNMPTKTSVSIGSLQQTIFQTTPLMPTYLLAFVISDFKNLHSNENFTVYARSDRVNDGILALEAGQKILEFLESYTGVEYIIPKMDQVAIPGRTGAMENWGLILYKEDILLHNSGSVDGGKLTIEVIAHEFAHQWFGNIVTPKWWKFVWLSEGVSKFFESYITDQIQPNWRSTDLSVIENIHELAFIPDSDVSNSFPLNRNVESPEEIQGMFDHISYIKGGAIVRMINHFLGKDIFKRGLNIYLTKNKFKSVDSTDFFQAFDEAIEEHKFNLGTNLDNIMHSWVNCKGYPVVTVTRNYSDPGLITIEQQRFYSDSNTSPVKDNEVDCVWYVPINYATAKDLQFDNTSVEFWLQEPSKNVSIETEPNDWLIINKQQTGFYRVNYDNKNWQLITNHLNSGNLYDIHVLNRAQLLDDALAFTKKGSLTIGTLLHLTLYLRKEMDYIALYPGNKVISWLQEHLRNTHHYSVFKEYVLNVAYNLLKSTGLRESTEDVYIDKQKRRIAIHWACIFEDETCTNYMKNKLEEEMNKSKKKYDPSGFDEITLCEGLRTASFSLWKKVFNEFINAQNYKNKLLLMSALGCSNNTQILQYYLGYTESVSYRNILYITDFIQKNSEYGVDSVLDHFTKIFMNSLPIKYVYELFLTTLFKLIGKKITTKAQLDKLKAFEKTQIPMYVIKKGIEAAEENIQWLEQNEDALVAWKEEVKVNIK